MILVSFKMEAEHCILMALPFGHSHYDSVQQRVILENGFIKYLGDKKAAGIVNVAAPGTQQVSYRIIWRLKIVVFYLFSLFL